MSYPELPYGVDPNDLDLDQVWKDVCEELTNPLYKNRTHPNRRTYDFGCRGPLCRKASRDYIGRRSPNYQSRYVSLNQVLLFFAEKASNQIAIHEASILEKLIS